MTIDREAMNTSEILIYQTADGKVKIDVRLEDETVWLTQEQTPLGHQPADKAHHTTHFKGTRL